MLKEIQVNKNKNFQNQTQANQPQRSIIKLVVACLCILGLAQVMLGCYLAGQSNRLKTISQQIQTNQRTNQRLKKDIAQFISLSKVKDQALKKGFTANPGILDLTEGQSFAFQNQ